MAKHEISSFLVIHKLYPQKTQKQKITEYRSARGRWPTISPKYFVIFLTCDWILLAADVCSYVCSFVLYSTSLFLTMMTKKLWLKSDGPKNGNSKKGRKRIREMRKRNRDRRRDRKKHREREGNI